MKVIYRGEAKADSACSKSAFFLGLALQPPDHTCGVGNASAYLLPVGVGGEYNMAMFSFSPPV